MAGDWIKFEATTPDKPEVVSMAAALSIDQDAVVGKLLRLWIWADQNSVSGNGVTVTSAFLDRLTFCPGFAKAMRDVGWLVGADGSLALPNFDRHNGKTAKERAVSNRRVAKHRSGNGEGNEVVTADVTPAPLQKPLPEKRREEKKEQKLKTTPSAAPTALPEAPDWVPADAWAGFVAMRRHERHSLTPRAAKLVLAELGRLRDTGADPGAVLDQSTRNGWRDVFPIREQQKLRAVSNGYQPLPGEV